MTEKCSPINATPPQENVSLHILSKEQLLDVLRAMRLEMETIKEDLIQFLQDLEKIDLDPDTKQNEFQKFIQKRLQDAETTVRASLKSPQSSSFCYVYFRQRN
jgi:hypothetical protein